MINISPGNQQHIDDYVSHFEQMNDAEVPARNEEIIAKAEAEYAEFVRAFSRLKRPSVSHPFTIASPPHDGEPVGPAPAEPSNVQVR
ncbi:hypothetical protein GCM10007862_04200 [Dyella lipolytica]|uniref:Uncharacterized protein n=1 Tax=Dyella lipolytica TaxID=1867835 RepID=A0ABW8J164_9GAMM|nr:hypothetical protein [Dyella lipolytica]GLQ45369.1 hypothetical protein GCM10007862_04200 [Dyella lipolytica]